MNYHQTNVNFERYDYSCSEYPVSLGKLTIGHKSILTPILWISYEFYNPRDLWKSVKNIRGLLVNIHNIESRKSLMKRLSKHNGLRGVIGFKGHMILDCGGIKFAKTNADYSLNKILKLANKINPDIVISPDYPISPSNPPEENRMRIIKTYKNFIETSQFFKKSFIPVMPVLHGYDFYQLELTLKKLQKIMEEIKIIGIGSLVPLLVPFTLNNAKKVIDLILYIRKRLPNAFIHVFGMGSILTMHLAFLAGADSIDSQSWVRSAGYGKIQIPGNGQLFIKKSKNRYKFEQWSRVIPINFNCNCPICSTNGKTCLVKSKRLRAMHNAYVLCSESEIVYERIKNGEYIDFAKERLKNTVLFSLFKYIKDKIRM
jgi:tRNA-guanine family transglycosylase